ncbi:MAG: exopolysaccharide transport family protein, partial [Vicinamibacterales bacterium]
MKTPTNRSKTASAAGGHPPVEEKHVMDYVRVLYKRRWIALPVFLLIFIVGALNALRETPMYEARTQLLIETDQPKVARLDQMFDNDGGYDEEFFQTQYRILQSRSLARRTIDAMKLWDARKLGNGPEPKEAISAIGLAQSAVSSTVGFVRGLVGGEAPAEPASTEAADVKATGGETPQQSGRIDDFLSGVGIVPVRNSRIVEVRYASTDPVFAAEAANALAKAYIQQSMEFRFSASKDAADFLGGQLAEQRKAVENSEAALQAFKERNGAVSVADSASNIVVARLTDLNSALTKAKTERINKEALYNQLKSAEGSGSLDTFPAVLTNEYVQKLKAELSDLQRQQMQLAERYGERHAEMIKVRASVQSTDAKLRAELSKVVESVRNEYQAALSEERSLQGALDSQKGEALSMNRKGIEYSVLQREVDSNREVYQSLLQQTKETGISSERRSSNIRVVDEAVTPRGPVSPNIPRALMVSLLMSLAVAVGIAFVFEQIDNRIRTPQEMKAYLHVPFLGMVPAVPKGTPGNPLLTADVPPNFVEAFKSVRTNVLFSSAEEGLRSLVVTSAGPGEGKSIVAANLAMALAQAGQRVLLI